MSLAKEARQFLRSTHSGILSTHSSKMVGYPFGSVTPFMLDHNAHPIMLISTIAEHTKNIIANPKVSLLAFAQAEDLQANSRLTLIGEAVQIHPAGQPLSDSDAINLRARYLRYFPQAVDYFEMHDFHFYRVHVKQARYIAGFGKMGWLDSATMDNEALTATPNLLASEETAIITHMNADHIHSLIAYCQYYHQLNATQVQMIGIDCDGFDVRVEEISETIDEHRKVTGQNTILRFEFDQPIHDALSARKALVRMSKIAFKKVE